jgi:phosphoglycerate dehydrogenase-like enzyme
MKVVIAPWTEPLRAIGERLDLRIVTAEEAEPRDIATAGFYVPEFSMRIEPLELLASLPSVSVVQALTAGVEHYLPWLPSGVTLCAGSDIHGTSVAEHAIALALADLRGIPEAIADARGGRWNRRVVRGLADRRVTVIGAGAIGRALVDRLRPFECEVTVVARTERPGVVPVAALDDVLRQSEVVFLCLPASDATDRLLDARRLALLPDSALVVNVGRGSTVDTDALERELAAGRLRAAVDVIDREPLAADDTLWASGAIVTPHIAGNATAFAPRAVRAVVAQLERWATGEPLRNVVVAG